MSVVAERLAIVGLGLLGGSVGLAARKRGVVRSVAGSSRNPEARAVACRCGAVDVAVLDPAEAVRGAGIVVLATPPYALPATLRAAAPGLAEGAVVTDVGSVKASVVGVLTGLVPPGVCYVGAHPMAGSHHRGIEHARADLFQGAACVLTPTPGVDPTTVARLARFWQALGARVVLRDPERHDLEVAWVSHLPHALAFAFARALAGAPVSARELVGAGFRDFSRIARSDPELWTEILSDNHKALAGPLRDVGRQLAELAQHLEAGDGDATERFLREARAALARLDAGDPAPRDARSGGANPEIPAAEPGSPERSSTHRT